MTATLKLAHFAALTVWCGGLLVLPSLYALRPNVEGKAELYRLHRFCRFAYVTLVSPSAFVTIATGIALIFLREVFVPWMGLKLVAVGALVGLHVRAGQLVNRVFADDGGYAPWRGLFTTGTVLVSILATLWLVLAKPAIDPTVLPQWIREAGALQSFWETTVPIP